MTSISGGGGANLWKSAVTNKRVAEMKKLLLISTAALFLATGAAARAAETFDWGKYCGDRNKYCDPSDSEDNKWQPPSAAELRACTKNGKLDYNCLRKSEPSSVLQSLPTSVQKSIKEIRERCLAIERENPPYGTADDDGLTFRKSDFALVITPRCNSTSLGFGKLENRL